NRTVKRLSADDSADTCVKVGHRQTPHKTKPSSIELGFVLCVRGKRFPVILESKALRTIKARPDGRALLC
ncbi:hypothetical protein, partial [Vogesella indigofera]